MTARDERAAEILFVGQRPLTGRRAVSNLGRIRAEKERHRGNLVAVDEREMHATWWPPMCQAHGPRPAGSPRTQMA